MKMRTMLSNTCSRSNIFCRASLGLTRTRTVALFPATRCIHDAARAGFTTNNVSSYESGRPSYSDNAIELISSIIKQKNSSGRYVPLFAELGAGTGKFTRRIYPALKSVFGNAFKYAALEPSQGFYNFLKDDLSHLTNVACYSDSAQKMTSFKDSQLDAVMAAQAFHWFASDETMNELYRTMKADKPLVMVWNTYDHNTPWIRDLDLKIVTPQYGPGVPRQQSRDWERVFDDSRPGGKLFTKTESWRGFYDIECTEEAVINRVVSTSCIAMLSPMKRNEVRAQVQELLRSHPDTKSINSAAGEKYKMRYETEVVWTFKR